MATVLCWDRGEKKSWRHLETRARTQTGNSCRRMLCSSFIREIRISGYLRHRRTCRPNFNSTMIMLYSSSILPFSLAFPRQQGIPQVV